MSEKKSAHPGVTDALDSVHSDIELPADFEKNWDRYFEELWRVPVKVFEGEDLHDENNDHFTVARLSEAFISTLSKKTKSRVIAAIEDATRGKSVAELVASGSKIDVAQILKNRGVHDFSSYEAVRGESRFLSELTEMDLLSSESMTSDEIRKVVKSLLVNEKGNALHEKEAVATINQTYQSAIDFLNFLGITPNETQKNRKFKSTQAFVEHIDSLKPGTRKNGYGMVIECAIIRAMDDVHDVLSNDRYKKLDQESQLVLEKMRSFSSAWLTIKDIGEGKFSISYFPTSPKLAHKSFQGILHMREKNFFKILLKMAFNRKYTNIDSLKDLLGLRFETENPDKNHLANAIEFFAKNVFTHCEYDQKGGLVDLEELKSRKLNVVENPNPKASTDEDTVLGDLTGKVAIIWGKSGWSRTTGTIEMQFQYVGGMDGWFRTSDYYDFKKFLTAASRKMKGFDIKNLKFFIRLFLAPATGMPEKAILERMFFPPKTPAVPVSELSMPKQLPLLESDSPKPDASEAGSETLADVKEKSPKDRFIDIHWHEEHGFLLPIATGAGGIRFTTLDAFSPEYYAVYGRHYPTPVKVDFGYLLKMYDRAFVDDKVKEYRHKEWGV